MQIADKYNPSDIEQKWYDYWIENRLFHSEPDTREPYTIVIPPPNVTGVLHMGHMLNETIQDILVRRARMMGKNACWVPGTDHASIATEAKVIKRLKEQGIQKSDLTREEFLKHAWAWTDEHGGIILKQLRKLGASCDWDRTAFTMDEVRSESVIKVFCDLYEKGYIYRGLRMVNWDPERQTALSDEEVIYHDEHSKLFYLKYYVDEPAGSCDGELEDAQTLSAEDAFDPTVKHQIIHRDADGRRYAVVATTRPETIMGDVAMCINPKDPKNSWLRGKRVIVPLVGRSIPVIEDRYVEVEFGTGCLKVTPAHDTNDYMLGQKYNLEIIDIFNADATISEAAGMYVGMDRFDTRKQIAKDLQEAGLMEKVEAYENKVGYSERTNVPIEPRLSLQWFLSMQHFADIALPPVMEDRLKFYPAKYKNTYRNWLENIKDWCISRQLWWGHRIPAYFLPTEDGTEKFVVAETAEKALEKARAIEGFQNLELEDLRQDDDALDTWFSSWLWPISLFNGIEQEHNAEIDYYYPTCDLVTGPDIIFFWVARMIMAGYEYKHDMPFRNVYFTGIVRDKLGRKMSKSLGNSPDPLELIADYGADGVRVAMMLCSSAGNDLMFDNALCEQGRNFSNKIWNAYRLVNGWPVDSSLEQSDCNCKAVEWFSSRLSQALSSIEEDFASYRISDALKSAYRLFWDDFSACYLEAVKPAYQKPIDPLTMQQTKEFFEKLMLVLHPYMPFITEEIWQDIAPRKKGESICVARMPEAGNVDQRLLERFALVQEAITGVRNIRQGKGIPSHEALELKVVADENYPRELESVLRRMANISELKFVEEKDAMDEGFIVKTTQYFVPMGDRINVEETIAALEKDLQYQQGFLRSVMGKLSNQRFVSSAPQAVVERERAKQADAEAKIAAIEQQLALLRK